MEAPYTTAWHIAKHIERHDFNAFINSDMSVSFELHVTEQIGDDLIPYCKLVTVSSMTEALTALGY